jgi:hypothetical protein
MRDLKTNMRVNITNHNRILIRSQLLPDVGGTHHASRINGCVVPENPGFLSITETTETCQIRRPHRTFEFTPPKRQVINLIIFTVMNIKMVSDCVQSSSCLRIARCTILQSVYIFYRLKKKRMSIKFAMCYF